MYDNRDTETFSANDYKMLNRKYNILNLADTKVQLIIMVL